MSRIVRLVLVVLVALPAAAQQIVDSPLVALAKRTGRLGKIPMSHVITNEDLAKYHGRMSEQTAEEGTTGAEAAKATVQGTSAWEVAAREAAERTAQDQQRRSAYARPTTGEGSSRATYTQMQPATATNATVTSSASSTYGASSTRSSDGQSNATSATYNQTASSSAPQPVQPRKVD